MDSLTVEDPTYIGPYRLIARLGAGGMGLVYLGRDEVGRTVAVKVVQAEYAAHPEFRKRFAREVAAARRVGGSWTADVLDADTDAGVAVPWVATQYIAGPDLTTVVARDFGPLPEHSVRVLANRLALALQAVHAAGLIHRDLKPSNVLVTVDGPRVIDFGIARAMDSLSGDSLHTRTGMLIGSPGFMSPEQVRGLPLTPASDVFCLGAVLVYAATGRLLFGATDTGLNAHLFRIAEEDPDLTGVPDSLLPLVRACLAKDPAQRPTPAQIAEHTAGDGGGVWLPGEVLAQLGRHAAQLLDYVPAARPEAPAEVRAAAAPAYIPTARDRGTPAPSPYRRWNLAVIALAQLAVLLGAGDTRSFLVGRVTPEFITCFAVPFGALLLLGGHIVDRVGGKRTLVTGLAGLAMAATLSGTTGALASELPLLLARLLQGASGALVTAAALALVSTGFPEPKERIRAFGIYATVSLAGPVLGLLMAQWMNWGSLLVIVTPLALIALAGTRVLPYDRPDRPDTRFDLPGVLLGALGTGGLVYGSLRVSGNWSASPAENWGDPLVVAPLSGGVVLFLAFLWWQSSASAPLLPAYVLKNRTWLGGFLALLLAGTGVPALAKLPMAVFNPFAHETKFTMLAVVAGLVIGSTQVSPRLLRRGVTPRVLVVTGLAITMLGLTMAIFQVTSGNAYPTLLPFMILAGLGMGLAFMPVFATATASAFPQHTGAASAAVIAAQLVGAGIGTALANSLPSMPWWAVACLLVAALTAHLTMPSEAPAARRG
ncbi:bifunctional serine/threonine protein kinase/MFS transporter [Streptomyces sp. NBC_00536]|uniref:bifunctional serine/threonine protein kinase/MFS transporter n=1 Tax=Streptomyces sp. NBC_00536 TaxID=2975769 RepID=UPI002E810A74|nr:bifunctional serine/threonine protein kinase/MFS transporter [Streptomyces sp. NBC_00536]WUC78781.1 bifunctional serine/threonine protein kinase/MFS transporter [Streptomyces sp. NBC_00536]